MRAAPGVKIAGKYELVQEIGRGAMGMVWRAYAEAPGLHCALKMVLPDGDPDDRVRNRLMREARLAAKLRSPYIVTVHDVGLWEDGAFIVMELLEGETLKQLLARMGRLPLEQVVELARQLALGLDKAHAAGLVHRDIKPDNIFVVDTDPLLVKLLDFGVAKQIEVDRSAALGWRTMTGALVGTPLYMSPEQASSASDLDFRSDLWSLAAVCFECLTGQPPFDGQSWPQLLINIIAGPIPIPSHVYPAVTPAVDAFWLQVARRDPKERPASALAMAELLRRTLPPTAAAVAVPALPVPAAAGESAWRRFLAPTAWMLLGAGLLGLLWAYSALFGGEPAAVSAPHDVVQPEPRAAAWVEAPRQAQSAAAVHEGAQIEPPAAAPAKAGGATAPLVGQVGRSTPAVAQRLEGGPMPGTPAPPAERRSASKAVSRRAIPVAEHAAKPSDTEPPRATPAPTPTSGSNQVDDELGF